MSQWHSIEIEEVFKRLNTTANGLSSEEVEARLEKYGLNVLRKEKERSVINIFLTQFKNILVVILIIASILSLIVGEIVDSLTIIAIIVACAILGFIQEFRAEKAIEALKKLTAQTAVVVRDGVEVEVPASQIVPGDVLVLRTGDRVPADARLIEAINLKVNEASLTGESVPVFKEVVKLPVETPMTDRRNMVYAGTIVTYGKGKAVVTETGMNTELGRITKAVQEVKREETPLEKRMSDVGRKLAAFCLMVSAIVALIGLLVWRYSLVEMIIWSISLAVAAVPEALPAVVTGALALGMYRMAKKNAIVRRLPAVETLGCTTIICSDKTGTITKGEMTVKKIFVEDALIEVTGSGYELTGEFKVNGEKVNPVKSTTLKMALLAAALCNDAIVEERGGSFLIKGDPTEIALRVVALKAGLKSELRSYRRVAEIPFSSERKRMTTIHEKPGGYVAFMKGAPEVVLRHCKFILERRGVKELSRRRMEKILEVNNRLAKDALRNIALAYKPISEIAGEVGEEAEREFIFLGIMGMIDPPRREVREAIETCKKAGIKVVMITGDHKLTAEAIAREVGIIDEEGMVLTGSQLDKMSDEELDRVVDEVKVYARVSPEHKLRIVKALKKRGHVVAMTGDGVNDAPALKEADIGVAMGVTGTEVSKEASDMVLSDDNFATIVSAVREGRGIFENIKKYLTYLLQCNLTEIILPLTASLIGLPLPLTAIQYLWINLTTDGLPALALGVDPIDPDVMEKPPRSPREGVFTNEVKALLATIPIISVAMLLTLYMNSIPNGLIEARTRIFTSMILMELAVALNCRSLRHSVFKAGIFRNKFLCIAIVASLIMQALILHLPQFHEAFDVTYPSMGDWIAAITVSLTLFIAVELVKLLAGKLRLVE